MQWQKIKNSLGTFYYSFSKTSKELLEIALKELPTKFQSP